MVNEAWFCPFGKFPSRKVFRNLRSLSPSYQATVRFRDRSGRSGPISHDVDLSVCYDGWRSFVQVPGDRLSSATSGHSAVASPDPYFPPRLSGRCASHPYLSSLNLYHDKPVQCFVTELICQVDRGTSYLARLSCQRLTLQQLSAPRESPVHDLLQRFRCDSRPTRSVPRRWPLPFGRPPCTLQQAFCVL